MRIFKNYLLNSSYKILTIFLPLITSPYLSRVLGVDGIGINTFTSSFTQYFILLAVLGTSSYGIREIASCQQDKKKRSEAFWGITFISWIASIVALILFFLVIIINKKYQEIFIWQSIAIFASMFDISWYFFGLEKFKITVIRNTIIKFLSVFAIFVFVKNYNDLAIYIIILNVSSLISNLSLWPYMINEIYFPNKLKNMNIQLNKHFKNTLVLFLPTVALTIYSMSGRTFLGIFTSVVQAGFFNQSDTLIIMSLSLVESISVVMMPYITRLFSLSENEKIKKMIIKLFNINTGVALGIAFGIAGISLQFAPFFFGKDFTKVGKVMMLETIVVPLIAWRGVLGTQYLLPLNKLKIYSTSFVIGVIFNLVINLSLIPLFGVFGAVYSLIITETVIVFYQYNGVKKDFKLYELFFGVWKYFVSGLVMFSCVFLMNQTFKMTILQLLLQIFSGVVIYSLMNYFLKTQLWLMFNTLIKRNIIR